MPMPTNIKVLFSLVAVLGTLCVALAVSGYEDIRTKETQLASARSDLTMLSPRAEKAKAFVSEVNVAEGWSMGPGYSKTGPFDTVELDGVLPDLVAKAVPQANAYGEPKAYGE